MFPVFIPKNMNSGGGGDVDIKTIFLIILIVVEIMQIIWATCELFSVYSQPFKTVWDYFYWYIPIWPPLEIVINKLMELGV